MVWFGTFLSFFHFLDLSYPTQALPRIFDPVPRLGMPKLWSQRHQHHQHLPQLLLPWPSCRASSSPLATVRDVGFGLIPIFTTVSALLLDQLRKAHKGGLSLGPLFSDSIFCNVVWNLAGTLGLYAFAGLIFVSLCELIFAILFFSLTSQPRSLSLILVI